MQTVTLQQLKQQVNVDTADTTYDEQLEQMADEAEALVLEYTGRELAWFTEHYGGIPLPLRRAVLLLVGDWFAYREGGRPSNLRPAEEAIAPIINRYRRLI